MNIGNGRKRRLPRVKGRSQRGDQTRRFKVKAHYRSPRGNNAGKPRVRVHQYQRGRPRRGPFA